jgi:DNA mismatch repair protein MutL
MTRIQQLPALVVNQIAAGEVIERPASVVKELLENSIDAGARRIEIDIEQGGAELIRVVDDGHGIHPDDLALAFASHATSKLRSADDLFKIDTFGFRGEALASIGGVAQVTLQSRPPALPAGALVSCQGSELSPVRPWNGSPGTRIEVRHLFFNTPVRRKFLRASATEMGHISEAVTRLALAHAHRDTRAGLHLVLRHNNKLVHEVPATTSLWDRIGIFFGIEVQSALLAVEGEMGHVQLEGFAANPSCERGSPRMQYLFVNGRCVRDRALGHAIQEAYRGLLMTGRYAVTFLFLTLPPDQVDVNVHPAKAEVRFRNAQAAHHLLYTTIRSRLREAHLTPDMQAPAGTGPVESDFLPPPRAFGLEGAPDSGGTSCQPVLPAISTSPAPTPPPARSLPAAPASWDRPEPPVAPPSPVAPSAFPPSSSRAAQPVEPAPRPEAMRGHTNKVIQLYDCYLVVETLEGMLVIDQHALHERILFEQFKRRIQAGSLETQALLIPEPIDFRPDQAARVLEQCQALAELGFGIEEFGGGTVLLTRYPVLLGQRSPREALRAVVEHLCARDRLPGREVLFNDLLSLMACHAAVRAGDRLTPEEMEALLAQRDLADDTHHCPHGRPTSLLFSRHELERQFRRA